MQRSLKVTLAILCAFMPFAHGFNSIHQASYDLEPRGMSRTQTLLSIAGIIDSRSTDVWEIPASLVLKPARAVELGAGIQTLWGEVGNHVPYLVFGVKFLTRSRTTFQADMLVPAAIHSGKGFSLASHHRFSHGGPFSSRLTARVGFMEALVEEDALMAFEAGWYPAVSLGRGLSLELGLIGSSQTEGFERNLAMDLQPGLAASFARASTLRASVALGLAGDRKEEMQAKVQVNHGF